MPETGVRLEEVQTTCSMVRTQQAQLRVTGLLDETEAALLRDRYAFLQSHACDPELNALIASRRPIPFNTKSIRAVVDRLSPDDLLLEYVVTAVEEHGLTRPRIVKALRDSAQVFGKRTPDKQPALAVEDPLRRALGGLSTPVILDIGQHSYVDRTGRIRQSLARQRAALIQRDEAALAAAILLLQAGTDTPAGTNEILYSLAEGIFRAGCR